MYLEKRRNPQKWNWRNGIYDIQYENGNFHWRRPYERSWKSPVRRYSIFKLLYCRRLNGSNTIIGQKNAFLAAENSVDVDIYFKKKLGAGLFGGEGFVLQKFTGNGVVFLEIDGEIIEKYLEAGATLLVDPGHIAAMEDTVDFDIEMVKGAKNILFGEGLFFSKVTGPGKVWIQTMPISKLAEAIIPFVPQKDG